MMMLTPLASCSLLMLIQGASGWSTTRTTTAITATDLNSGPSAEMGMLAFFAPTAPRRFANVNQQQQQQRAQHRRPGSAGLYRQPSPPARGRAARRAAPRARAVLACSSDALVDEERREGCNTVSSSSSGSSSSPSSSKTNINLLAGSSLTAAWSMFPAGAWAAAAAIVGDAGGAEMGARLDAPAAISFGAVMAAFAFLQVICAGNFVFVGELASWRKSCQVWQPPYVCTQSS